MAEVHIGDGRLSGRGIYASRRFEKGEVVVSYELQRLTRDEYLALTDEERRRGGGRSAFRRGHRRGA